MALSTRLTTAAAVSAALVAWASAFPAIRLALSALAPAELASARFTVAAVPALGLLAIRRPPRPPSHARWRLAFGGLIFVAGYSVLLNIGERSVAAGTASFIVNLNVVLTVLLSATFLKEKLGLRAWIGSTVSLGGLALLVSGDGRGMTLNVGALFVLGAAVCYAAATIVQKPLYAVVDPLSASCITILIGATVLLPALPSAAIALATAEARVVSAVVYLGIVPSFVAYGAWAVALSRMPAGRAANFLYCVPPLSTLIAIPLLGELPSSLTLAGGAVVLAGVAIVNFKRGPRA